LQLIILFLWGFKLPSLKGWLFLPIIVFEIARLKIKIYVIYWFTVKKIWQIIITGSTLRQFFVIHLSRKAEGNGPLKPWQPEMIYIY